jgi:hypothetical protein
MSIPRDQNEMLKVDGEIPDHPVQRIAGPSDERMLSGHGAQTMGTETMTVGCRRGPNDSGTKSCGFVMAKLEDGRYILTPPRLFRTSTESSAGTSLADSS